MNHSDHFTDSEQASRLPNSLMPSAKTSREGQAGYPDKVIACFLFKGSYESGPCWNSHLLAKSIALIMAKGGGGLGVSTFTQF